MADNGREEQWRKVGVEEIRGPTGNVKMAQIYVPNQGLGQNLYGPEWLIDAILAARAQAGLAQRYREELTKANQTLHVLIHAGKNIYTREGHYKEQVLAPAYFMECPGALCVDARKVLDSLTAGPTAAAEVNDGE